MMIYHIKQPNWPMYRFEWHPEIKRVYLIRLWEDPPQGRWIAADICDQGSAINAVNIFMRGFKEHSVHGSIVESLGSRDSQDREEIRAASREIDRSLS